MSSLTEIEKRYFEELFGMRSGYVLDFSDHTFSEFFRSTVRVDIDNLKYGGTSKGKRLRSFWEQETDTLVGKVLGEMLKVWVHKQPDRAAALNNYSYLEARKTVARLIGQSSGTEVSSEDDFLGKDFGSIDLKQLNLESGLLPILESRLKEIRVCLGKGAPLAAVILSGSMLEGLLLSAAIHFPQKFNQSKCSPRDRAGAVLQFQDWTLSTFIDAAHDIGLLGLDVKKHGHALRDFRNFIHPYQHMRANFTPDAHTAKISLQVLLAAIADLSGQRGRQTRP
jgi:hypothetical protein